MKSVGAYEAKTHLPELLERVAGGERITITKHGVPVAKLVPADVSRSGPAADIIEQVREFRANHRLGRQSLRSLIEEGRS